MKCWRCGKEFYSENWNRTLCDDCITGRSSIMTTTIDYNDQKIFTQDILLVEEGSVNTEVLDEMNIKYVMYKKGSQKPELIKMVEFYGRKEQE